jgi:transcriptional regulator with XRE-family HTH domain
VPSRENSDSPGPRRRHRSFAVRGDFLRSLRMARGWTQKEAARRADVSDRLVRKAEAGGPLEAKTISALAALYRTPELRLEPEQLMSDSGAVEREPPAGGSLAERVQRWFDGQWRDLNLDVIDELAIPDFVFHAEWGVIHGAAEMKERVLKFREFFSDIDMVADEVIDLGDAIAVRWRATMTHSGTWLGVPPTGKRIVIWGSSWVEMVGDKFGDAWDFWDPGLIHQQLADEA